MFSYFQKCVLWIYPISLYVLCICNILLLTVSPFKRLCKSNKQMMKMSNFRRKNIWSYVLSFWSSFVHAMCNLIFCHHAISFFFYIEPNKRNKAFRSGFFETSVLCAKLSLAILWAMLDDKFLLAKILFWNKLYER